MRILLCTNEDIVGNVIANLFLPVLAAHDVGLLLCNKPMLPKDGAEVHPSMWELNLLEQVIPTTQLFPMMEADGDEGEYLTFNQLSRFYGVPVERIHSLQDADALPMMQAFQPDMVLSVRFGSIFKPEHLALAPLGVWNFHSGLLPRYRGVMPTFRAMLHGEKEVGITLHRITDAAIDVGEWVDERRMAVHRGHSMLWHVLKLYPLARQMMAELVTKLDEDVPVETRIIPSEGQYFSAPNRAEVDGFEAKGLQLYNMDDYRELMFYYGDNGLDFMPVLEADRVRYAVAA